MASDDQSGTASVPLQSQEEFAQAEEYSQAGQAEAFTNLELEVSEGTLHICCGESFSLTRRDGKAADYEVVGDTLYVKVSHANEVVLALPEHDIYGAVRLAVKNGHAYGEDSVTADRLTLQVTQGHLAFAVPFEESDCNYEITVSGGTIRLGSHNYNGRSASQTLDYNAARSMALSCTHGDLSVEFGR